MFKDQDAIYAPSNMFIWFILAFQGGIINVGGFMAVHRFVSHVTGYFSMTGYWAANGDFTQGLGMLLVPCFYFFGILVSGWFIERRRLRLEEPLYILVLGMMILNFIIIFSLGRAGLFGNFGETFSLGRDYVLLFFLAYTCGLQNAVISSASGYAIRTTHMTGLITDLGIGIVRLWTMKKTPVKKEIFVNWCRFGILFSFLLGSVIGAVLFKRFHFDAFLSVIGLSAFSAYRLRAQRIEERS